MLFQSQGFTLIFLPLAVLAYYAVARSVAARQYVLIAASLVFYGWWDARFIPLLVGQITASWLLAVLGARLKRAWPLYAGIVLNLASLATFKYLDFLIGSLQGLIGVELPRAHILLPIGISFFSFQLISYLVDRLRDDAPIYPFRPFALFVMLFPHLIAGPIVRHNELVPQFDLDPFRPGLWQRIGTGLVLFTIGFAKKVLLADKLAEMADPLFARAGHEWLSFGDAWTAALAFSFQLFLDFSAYTEMAIGIALLFGLLLPENFRRPYLSTSLRDFWRRWHISLSNFIRDYLYIPLGGSRNGPVVYVFATLVAMAICGLWHGAGWTYVAWGVWHGLGLIVCHAWQKLRAAHAGTRRLGHHHAVRAGRLGAVSRRRFFHGNRRSLPLWPEPTASPARWATRRCSALPPPSQRCLPSAYEIMERRPILNPAVAAAFAVLAGFCVLEVGRGPPLSFIYFRF